MKVTAPQRPPTATLTRGLTSNNEVWEWRARVETGGVAGARRNATIVMFDQTAQEIARWNLVNAWPAKVTGAGNNSGDPPTEVVTLVADSIRYTGP